MDDHPGVPVLDAVQQRVLGSLLEKERTVPGSYPMTINGLRTACNQSSSRDPIMDLDEATILRGITALKGRGLARIVHAGTGARVEKYRQVLDERLELDDAHRALVTVLLLRGPQSVGELRTRTERLHPFTDRDAVEAALAELAGRSEPLVRELPHRPGQHDARWVHFLGPVEVAPPLAGKRALDRDVVIADGAAARDAKVLALYEAVADRYADEYLHELDGKPFDRWLLHRVAELAGGGPVADVGCGPGQIAFQLAAAGADVTGFDLSPAMVAAARRAFPDLPFHVADLTDLPLPDGGSEGWAAITAWYSLVHLAASELRPAIGLMAQRLRPGGCLAVAVHVGDEVRHVSDLLGMAVDADFVLHDQGAVLDAFAVAGLTNAEWYLRSPNGREVATERLYVIGQRV